MNNRARAAVIIAAIVLLDRVTKIYIRSSLSMIDTVAVIPGFFNIVHTENPGAAFSMLATAPAEAAPSAGPTLAPTYTAFGDDSVLYVYESLPAGTYQFRFRARAGTVGSFTEPPATAEMMYRQGADGASAGSRLVIAP